MTPTSRPMGAGLGRVNAMSNDSTQPHQGASTPGDPWQRHSWLVAAIWLAFIFYPVRALVGSTAAMPAQVLGWSCLGLFIVVYLVSFRLGHNTGITGEPTLPRTWVFFAVAVLAVVGTVPAIGDGAFSFLPFVVTIPAYQMPTWFFLPTIAVSVLGLLGYILISGEWADNVALLIILLVICAVHWIVRWLIGRSIAADKLATELVASEERETVARDVHDLIGHSLTVVKLKAQLARKLVRADPDRAVAELEEIERITSEAIGGVRATVTGLRSEGLAAQLNSAIATLQDAGTVVEVEGEPTSLSPAQSLIAAWILREATTNTLRHAHASRVCISMGPGSFTFEDDGVGLPADAVRRSGNGLSGMAERAVVSGATFSVDASQGLGGTRVGLSW